MSLDAPEAAVFCAFRGRGLYDPAIGTRLFQAFLPYHTKSRAASVLHDRASPLVDLFWRWQMWMMKRQLNIPAELVPDENLPVGLQNIGTGGDVYERVRAGRIVPKRAEISRFLGDDAIRLSTGETVRCDVVVFATGWKQHLDFLSPQLRDLVRRDGFFTLYRHILPPEEKRLGFVGYASSIGHTLSCEMSAHWLASSFLGAVDLPDTAAMYREIAKVRAWTEEMLPGLGGGYAIAPYIVDYVDTLLEDMGLPTHQASNFIEEYFGRFHPERFRDVADKRRQIMRAGSQGRRPGGVRR